MITPHRPLSSASRILLLTLLAVVTTFQSHPLIIGQTGHGETKPCIQGAGATFPNPLYQEWFRLYYESNNKFAFDYQSKGSGFGIQQITAETVDFAGSDAPMKDDQLKAAPRQILHIPTTMGAVVVTYNNPDFTEPLNLTPEALAGIYLGTIEKWNSPAIVWANPRLKLKDEDIAVVHRSDGSGTTFIFTDYLSKVSPKWKKDIGANASVNWPAGNGANGSEGVLNLINETPYSIGYVDYIYAKLGKMPMAPIQNSSGPFITPTLQSITEAGDSAAIPNDMRASITNPPGYGAYPIASFTYFLVYKEQTDKFKGKALADFLWWAIHDGQEKCAGLNYAPLPSLVVDRAEKQIDSMTFKDARLRIPAAGKSGNQ